MHSEKKNPLEVASPSDCFISVSFIGPRALASSPCSALLLSCDMFAVAFSNACGFSGASDDNSHSGYREKNRVGEGLNK